MFIEPGSIMQMHYGNYLIYTQQPIDMGTIMIPFIQMRQRRFSQVGICLRSARNYECQHSNVKPSNLA